MVLYSTGTVLFSFFLPPIYAYVTRYRYAPSHLRYPMGKLVYLLYQSSSEFVSSIFILNVVRDLGVQIRPDAEA